MNCVEEAPSVLQANDCVSLDLELCKACGICIELCPDKVFDRDKLGNPVLARPEDCTQCLICELHCPDFAIEVRRRERKVKAPVITQEDLIAATSGAQSPDEVCDHDSEG